MGLAELCRRLIEQEWRDIGRGWKIVDYRYTGGNNRLSDAIFNTITTIKPGWGMTQMIPVERDLGLQQRFEIDVEICYDECTKKTTRRIIAGRALNKYQEVWFNPTSEREGDPVWRAFTDLPPSITTRWGVR